MPIPPSHMILEGMKEDYHVLNVGGGGKRMF